MNQHTIDEHVQQIIMNRRLNVIEPGAGFWHLLRGRLDGSKITGTDRVSRRIKFDYLLRPGDLDHYKDMTDFKCLTPLSFLDRESSTDNKLARWFDETNQFITIETPEPLSPRWIDLLADAYRVYAPDLSVYLPQIMIRYAGLELELFEQILRYYGDRNKRTHVDIPSAFRHSLKRHYGWIDPHDDSEPMVFEEDLIDSASESGSSDEEDGVVRALIMAADGSMMKLSVDPSKTVPTVTAAQPYAGLDPVHCFAASSVFRHTEGSTTAATVLPRSSDDPSPLATSSSDKKYPFDWKSNAPRHYCNGHFAMSPDLFAVPPRPVKAPPPVKVDPPPLPASIRSCIKALGKGLALTPTWDGWTKGKDLYDKGKGKAQEKGKFARAWELDAARKGRAKGHAKGDANEDTHDHAVLENLATLALDVRRMFGVPLPRQPHAGLDPVSVGNLEEYSRQPTPGQHRADYEADLSQPDTEVEGQALPWQSSSDLQSYVSEQASRASGKGNQETHHL
jgi:hypothetical protein